MCSIWGWSRDFKSRSMSAEALIRGVPLIRVLKFSRILELQNNTLLPKANPVQTSLVNEQRVTGGIVLIHTNYTSPISQEHEAWDAQYKSQKSRTWLKLKEIIRYPSEN